MICTRCGKETDTHTMSMFNTDEICIPCQDIEKQHPDYNKARDTEHEEVKKGNLNFKGIGKPKDLLKWQLGRDVRKGINESIQGSIKRQEGKNYK